MSDPIRTMLDKSRAFTATLGWLMPYAGCHEVRHNFDWTTKTLKVWDESGRVLLTNLPLMGYVREPGTRPPLYLIPDTPTMYDLEGPDKWTDVDDG
jgi:hypothetical protein